MFTNILLAVDGSEVSLRAARHGIELAAALGARVTVVTITIPWTTHFSRELAVVVPDVVVPKSEYDRKRETLAADILKNVMAEAQFAHTAAKAVHLSHDDPYKAIIDTAAQESCDLVVMGSHRDSGITGALLGSESMKVLTHTNIPVLIYRQTC
jgi:nucleotide-binding universal stress UspA family protein